jgi:hypothetical protein
MLGVASVREIVKGDIWRFLFVCRCSHRQGSAGKRFFFVCVSGGVGGCCKCGHCWAVLSKLKGYGMYAAVIMHAVDLHLQHACKAALNRCQSHEKASSGASTQALVHHSSTTWQVPTAQATACKKAILFFCRAVTS